MKLSCIPVTSASIRQQDKIIPRNTNNINTNKSYTLKYFHPPFPQNIVVMMIFLVVKCQDWVCIICKYATKYFQFVLINVRFMKTTLSLVLVEYLLSCNSSSLHLHAGKPMGIYHFFYIGEDDSNRPGRGNDGDCAGGWV